MQSVKTSTRTTSSSTRKPARKNGSASKTTKIVCITDGCLKPPANLRASPNTDGCLKTSRERIHPTGSAPTRLRRTWGVSKKTVYTWAHDIIGARPGEGKAGYRIPRSGLIIFLADLADEEPPEPTEEQIEEMLKPVPPGTVLSRPMTDEEAEEEYARQQRAEQIAREVDEQLAREAAADSAREGK
jgi:hypothetical protein